jgi:hypothetical protein
LFKLKDEILATIILQMSLLMLYTVGYCLENDAGGSWCALVRV